MPEPVRILLVEDEALTALLLKRELEEAGCQVHKPIATGEAAVEAARIRPVDVVVMDIRLAGRMDGIAAAEMISSCCAAPIIFTTGYNDDEIRERALALGPAAYLVKPVTIGDLMPVIIRLLSRGPGRETSLPDDRPPS